MIFQKMIAAALVDYDIDYVFTTTTNKRLDTLKNDNFDCIYLALFLDDMDGFEFTQQIRKLDNYQHTPIVLTTSKNNSRIFTTPRPPCDGCL